jgi:hypothetical protein
MSMVFNFRLIASTVPAQASELDFFPSSCDSHDLRAGIYQCLT